MSTSRPADFHPSPAASTSENLAHYYRSDSVIGSVGGSAPVTTEEKQYDYPRVHRRYMSQKTLESHEIPFEIGKEDSHFLVVKREMTELEMKLLTEHTTYIRQQQRQSRTRSKHSHNKSSKDGIRTGVPKVGGGYPNVYEESSLLGRLESYVEGKIPIRRTWSGGVVGCLRYLSWEILHGRRGAEEKLRKR